MTPEEARAERLRLGRRWGHHVLPADDEERYRDTIRQGHGVAVSELFWLKDELVPILMGMVLEARRNATPPPPREASA